MSIVDETGHRFAIPLWADVLQPHQAEALLRYDAAPYTHAAALTSHTLGQGRALYLGVYPTQPVLNWLWQRLLPEIPREFVPGIEVLPLEHGWACLNHTDDACSVQLAGRWYDQLSGDRFVEVITIPARDVRIVRSEA